MKIPVPSDPDHRKREEEIGKRYQERLRVQEAASDLLASLEEIVAFLNTKPHQEVWEMNPLLIRADKAIAKAKRG